MHAAILANLGCGLREAALRLINLSLEGNPDDHLGVRFLLAEMPVETAH